jgi:aminoglycoside phosphotransferase (APT) family kinase protein
VHEAVVAAACANVRFCRDAVLARTVPAPFKGRYFRRGPAGAPGTPLRTSAFHGTVIHMSEPPRSEVDVVPEAAQRPARAQGPRAGFEVLPPALMAWIHSQLDFTWDRVLPQTGGMSPGPEVRLLSTSGHRVFLKAVGTELNPDSPELFRHEIQVLEQLPDVPYRARLRASYDDGDWVALLLDDVEGRHPDLSDDADRECVVALIDEQSVELTPAPNNLPPRTLADNARIWAHRWERLMPIAPPWLVDRFADLTNRVQALADRLPLTTLCHWDIREDNLLVRADGSVVVVDWGMSRVGPAWADHLLFALSHPRPTDLQALLAAHAGEADLIIDTVLGLAGSQLVRSGDPTPPGLPAIRQFQEQDALALFTAVRPHVMALS